MLQDLASLEETGVRYPSDNIREESEIEKGQETKGKANANNIPQKLRCSPIRIQNHHEFDTGKGKDEVKGEKQTDNRLNVNPPLEVFDFLLHINIGTGSNRGMLGNSVLGGGSLNGSIYMRIFCDIDLERFVDSI